MSLSKFFKSPVDFKPENLLQTKQEKKTGWEKTPLPNRQPESPFSPDGRVKEHSDHVLSEPTEQAVHKPSQNPVTESVKTTTPPITSEIDIEPEVHPPQPTASIPEGYVSATELQEKEMAAFQQGKQEGISEGRLQVEDDYSSATKALVSLCTQLETFRETIVKNSGKELQDFALAIAERIVRYSIIESDKTIIATIEEALQRSIKSSEFYIFLNPEDYDNVAAKSADIVASFSGLENIVLKTDNNIERGGARIESENCIVDATIASQFEIIREEIKNNS